MLSTSIYLLQIATAPQIGAGRQQSKKHGFFGPYENDIFAIKFTLFQEWLIKYSYFELRFENKLSRLHWKNYTYLI